MRVRGTDVLINYRQCLSGSDTNIHVVRWLIIRCRHKYLDIKALTRAIDRPLPLRVLSLARSHMGIKSLEVLTQSFYYLHAKLVSMQ